MQETSVPSLLELARRPSGLGGVLKWAWHSWATRSLLIGAVATVVDLAAVIVCVEWLGWLSWTGAMLGVSIGAVFTFFANRHFAFRDHHPDLAPQAVKFAIATVSAMFVHAGVVWMLTERLGIHYVFSKFLADLAVFSVGQLLVLRYVVFPKKKPEPEPVPVPAVEQLDGYA